MKRVLVLAALLAGCSGAPPERTADTLTVGTTTATVPGSTVAQLEAGTTVAPPVAPGTDTTAPPATVIVTSLVPAPTLATTTTKAGPAPTVTVYVTTPTTAAPTTTTTKPKPAPVPVSPTKLTADQWPVFDRIRERFPAMQLDANLMAFAANLATPKPTVPWEGVVGYNGRQGSPHQTVEQILTSAPGWPNIADGTTHVGIQAVKVGTQYNLTVVYARYVP